MFFEWLAAKLTPREAEPEPIDRKSRRLVSLAERAHQASEPVERARLAAELRDLAETVVESSICETNRAGITWRDIGARLGVPFRTL